MFVPLNKFTTTKWVVIASKIDLLFIGIGITSAVLLYFWDTALTLTKIFH